MGTITSRKRKDHSTAYTAQIRINRDGKTVYQESQTFDRKQVAQGWIKRRETELAQLGAIERANRKGVTIKQIIEQYLANTKSCVHWARPSEPHSWLLVRPGWVQRMTHRSPVKTLLSSLNDA